MQTKLVTSSALLIEIFLLLLTLSGGFATQAQSDDKPPGRRQLIAPLPASVVEGKPVPVLFLDADGNLRPSIKPGAPPNGPEEVTLLPFVASKIREYNERGYFVAIVSNQAGIPRFTTLERAEATMYRTITLLRDRGAIVHHYDFAENYDGDRKPGIGMGIRLEDWLKREFKVSGIDREHSVMVGDAAWARADKGRPAEIRPDGRPGFNHSNADRMFAENFGIRFAESADFFGWRQPFGIDAFELLTDLRKFYTKFPEVAATEACENLLLIP